MSPVIILLAVSVTATALGALYGTVTTMDSTSTSVARARTSQTWVQNAYQHLVTATESKTNSAGYPSPPGFLTMNANGAVDSTSIGSQVPNAFGQVEQPYALSLPVGTVYCPFDLGGTGSQIGGSLIQGDDGNYRYALGATVAAGLEREDRAGGLPVQDFPVFALISTPPGVVPQITCSDLAKLHGVGDANTNLAHDGSGANTQATSTVKVYRLKQAVAPRLPTLKAANLAELNSFQMQGVAEGETAVVQFPAGPALVNYNSGVWTVITSTPSTLDCSRLDALESNNAAIAWLKIGTSALPDGKVVPEFCVATDFIEPAGTTGANWMAATARCEAVGARLISDEQYLAMAHQAVMIASNWDGGVVGVGSVTGLGGGSYQLPEGVVDKLAGYEQWTGLIVTSPPIQRSIANPIAGTVYTGLPLNWRAPLGIDVGHGSGVVLAEMATPGYVLVQDSASRPYPDCATTGLCISSALTLAMARGGNSDLGTQGLFAIRLTESQRGMTYPMRGPTVAVAPGNNYRLHARCAWTGITQ